MKKATLAALLLSALASGYGITCHAATYDYTQAMGSLELEFSEESGDPIVTIETVNPNNGSTCSFESEGCRFDEDGLTCFSETGDLVLKYRDDDLIEVTAEPDGMCGLNATMLGYYTPREESAAHTLYRPTSGEGSLQLEFSEDSGDPIVTIETVNPNNGSTCSFESEGCRFDEDGLTCFSESGDLVLKYRENDVIEVTQEPDGMCGLNATMLGTYVPAQSTGSAQSANAAPSSVPTLYRPTSSEGMLQLEFSEESGDPLVTIETVNPNNGSTCSFESEGCRFDEDGLTCFSESGDLVLKYRENDVIEVTQEPDGMCGLNATMLGTYVPAQSTGSAQSANAAPSSVPTLYRPTSSEGMLQLEFSEESGDPLVTIETVNPNNGSTCSFESEGCRFDEDGLTCFSESGDLVLKYRDNDVIEVTQEPDGICGLNATMLGTYVPAQSSDQAQSSGATVVYRPDNGEGTLSIAVSEESGDVSVAIETVNPNSGHTCSFESEVCNLTDAGLSCPSEDGALELKFLGEDTVEVTAEPSGMCGLRATMLGVYRR